MAHLVREAVARHDPRGGGRTQQRRRRSGAGESSERRAQGAGRRAQTERAAGGTAATPAGGSATPAPQFRRGSSPDGAHAGRRHGALFLPLFGAWCGHATRGVVVTAIRSPAVAVALPTRCKSTTCCRSPRAAAKIRIIYASRASLITGCGTAVSRLRNWKVGIRHCVMGLGGRQRQRLPGRERAQERTSSESVPVCAAPRRSCEPVRIRARSPCAH